MTLSRLPMCADQLNNLYENYSLLDIGCRTMALKPFLKKCSEYYGTDIMPAEGVIACNLEEGLPDFVDNSYDVVVALDVLEHLEHCHLVLDEMIRVARKAVIVSLPNMYYIQFRMKYLRGDLSGKYNFPEKAILDRHRWVLSYNAAVRFIDANTKGLNVSHHKVMPTRGRTKLISEPIEKMLATYNPDLFAYGSMHVIRLDET